MAEPIQLSPSASSKVADIQERKEVTARASATPLPGSLADAFAIAPDITVGKYKVRPFCEIDFEFLQALEHPLYDMLIATFSGKENKADYFPRGQVAWELCYIFTHPIDEVEELFKTGTGYVKEAAKKEFGKATFAGVLVLHKAVLKQVMAASQTAIAYGSATDDDDGSKKNAVAEQPSRTDSVS
jgi:hypothetical protein